MKNYFLIVGAFCTLIACNSANKQTEEINDSNTPLHLLKPDYKVPYGELSADEVKAALDRIYDYIEAERPTGFLDKDGKLTGIDSTTNA